MATLVAPGLTADWLNGWLAAIGVTVLCPEVRLSWTDDPIPKAVLDHPDADNLPELIADRLPSIEDLDLLVIAHIKSQNLTPEEYRAAAVKARTDNDSSLALLTTDLAAAKNARQLPKGPFNVARQGKATLFTGLRACRARLAEAGEHGAVASALGGHSSRFDGIGLGFDYRGISASVPAEAHKLVDPAVEVLAFHGLLLHPIGGDGQRAVQRGWRATWPAPHAFCWPVWQPALDVWSVDGLLDAVYRDMQRQAKEESMSWNVLWSCLGVSGIYALVPFRVPGKDITSGYGSERLI